MKKIISLILTILFIVITLAGCAGSKSTDTNKPEGTKVEGNNTETNKEASTPAENITYKDGTYEGVGEGMNEIKVSVEVTGGKIAKVTITKQEETADIAKPALEKIPAAIVAKNSPDVDVVSGATRASEGIIEAVKNALEAAK
jgi:uncharacterized protein with FMN-binding domain